MITATKEQIGELLIWAYKQGFMDAIKSLEDSSKMINEEQMMARFVEQMVSKDK